MTRSRVSRSCAGRMSGARRPASMRPRQAAARWGVQAGGSRGGRSWRASARRRRRRGGGGGVGREGGPRAELQIVDDELEVDEATGGELDVPDAVAGLV